MLIKSYNFNGGQSNLNFNGTLVDAAPLLEHPVPQKHVSLQNLSSHANTGSSFQQQSHSASQAQVVRSHSSSLKKSPLNAFKETALSLASSNSSTNSDGSKNKSVPTLISFLVIFFLFLSYWSVAYYAIDRYVQKNLPEHLKQRSVKKPKEKKVKVAKVKAPKEKNKVVSDLETGSQQKAQQPSSLVNVTSAEQENNLLLSQ
mmetsp:Transcript_16373/g.27703  ORF Transcript_16373/g.27703 Transcript_16373/m.27703 type:complete len:202 (+) Transcript_16373:322-927(+)